MAKVGTQMYNGVACLVGPRSTPLACGCTPDDDAHRCATTSTRDHTLLCVTEGPLTACMRDRECKERFAQLCSVLRSAHRGLN